MLNNAFGLIYTGEAGTSLRDLTMKRSVAAVPFGGRYRIIDFVLSNMVNSGVRNVGVLTQKNYHSLIDHLGSGSAWDLQRKRDGMFILPPFVTSENNGIYRGTIDAIRAARIYLEHVKYRYCLFTDGHTVYNTTYEKMMQQHLETNADITFMYATVDPIIEPGECSEDVRLVLNERGRVTDMEFDAYRPKSLSRYLGCMLIDKTLLEYLVDEATSRGMAHLLRDMVFRRLDTLNVYGFKYDGYFARIDSVQSYFTANMDMLNKEKRMDLFDDNNTIYTKVKDEVPALYKETGVALNSLVADGCVIDGELENCVLFRGVRVGRGAQIKNSIILQDTEVQTGARLENVILDKDVIVKRDRRLIGVPNFPVIVKKGAVI